VLIGHYIEAHGYSPPAVFQAAVLDCPLTATDAYFDLLALRGYTVDSEQRMYWRSLRGT